MSAMACVPTVGASPACSTVQKNRFEDVDLQTLAKFEA
jgi:hypothetical protein